MTSPGPDRDTRTRSLVWWEVATVLALSLVFSASLSVLDLLQDLLRGRLPQQTTTLIQSGYRNDWLDLAYQLLLIARQLAPVALVGLLLRLRPASIGLARDRPRRDLGRGAAVAAAVGGAGLALYLLARALGLAVTVVPSSLQDTWWRIPVLVLAAAQNAVLEEVLLLGWLRVRLAEVGWSWGRYVAAMAVLRGAYHLYQGFGAFAGNAVMGVLFAVLARRWRRITPLLWAHFLIDAVAFVGAVLLAGHVSWLPA